MLRKSLFLLMFGLITAGQLFAQWHLINPLPTNNNLRDMIFLNARQGVAVGMNGTILKSSDWGSSWKAVTATSFTHLNSIASPDSVSLFICGDRGLLLKTDFSFARMDTLESGEYGNLNKIRFINSRVGFCIGNDRLILKTTDAGRHWSPATSGFRGDLLDLSFVDDSLGYLAGKFYTPFSEYSANLMITHDQGESWQLIDSLPFEANVLCFTDSLTGFIGGYDLLKTTDGGETWTKDFSINGIADIGGTGDRVWAIGAYGTILSNKSDSGFGVSDSTHPLNLIKSMYPNPFQQLIDIALNLEDGGSVQITVNDLTGRRLDEVNLVLPGGESIQTYDGSHLPPGIYILTVRTDSGFSSARMLKIGE